MQKMYFPGDTWDAIEPEQVKADKTGLMELEPVIREAYPNIDGIVIVKDGYIICEKYFNGTKNNDARHVASVTKSVISALIGVAVDREYIRDIDQKILEFFPEYRPDPARRQIREITIRHLLTMTAPYPYKHWHEPLRKMCMQHDWVNYTLDMLGENGAIGDFKYSTAGAHLLSAIITRTTGKSARAFANEYLFGPIGIKQIPDYAMDAYGYDDLFGKKVRGWVKDPLGNSTGGWGLTLTPRDMARFGLLYIRGGCWNSGQVISKGWIEDSVSEHSGTVIDGLPIKYGYLWWLREYKGCRVYLALGDGGNVLCCIPDAGLVVAILSEFMAHPADRWKLIEAHILPTVFSSDR